MAARGRLAATLFVAFLIGGALSFKCYSGDLGKEEAKAADGTATCDDGGMCKLEIKYSNVKLSDIQSVTGSCIPAEKTGCWKYQGEKKAVCQCAADHCNSRENQQRALKAAINPAARSQGAWAIAGATILFAIHHNSR